MPLIRGNSNKKSSSAPPVRLLDCDGENGQTTILMTFFMATFLFGFIGLGIDVQTLFAARRQAQAAADAAAVAAAEESSYSSTIETNAAYAAAKLNGFDTGAATNPATVTLSTPSGGNYSGSSSDLQVIVSKPIPVYFSSIVTGNSTITISARSVAAAGQNSPTCLCLEGTSGTDLTISGGSTVAPTGCGTTIDSTSNNAVVISGGSSSLSGPTLGMSSTSWTKSSEVSGGATISASTKIVQGVGTSCAPPLPTAPTYNSAQCGQDPLNQFGGSSKTYNVGPGALYTTTQTGSVVCYTSLKIGSNSDIVNMNPGIYVIYGGQLEFAGGANNSSNTGGSGVFFYLTNGAKLTIDGGANANVTAPTSGTYAGIVVFQDPADTQNMTISGGSNISFNGAIYAPTVAITISGGSGTNIDADIVAKTMTVSGGGSLNSAATANFGTLNTSVAKLVE